MSSKTNKPDTAYWDRRRGVIRSRKGGWIIGKGVFCHGYSMLDDLVGKASYMQVMVLNATGRMPEPRLAEWFEAAHICLSWPDPRIWCNHIGALGATARVSVVAATVAGLLAADSRSYGMRTLVEGVNFIRGAHADLNSGVSVQQIVEKECARHDGKPYIMGYARPLAKGDERLVAMERVAEKLGFVNGEHLSLAYEIEQFLMETFDEGMNIAGYMSAFLSDQGFSAEQAYRIFTILVNSGVTACYVDVLESPPESFLPLRCDDIDYQGRPPRPLP